MRFHRQTELFGFAIYYWDFANEFQCGTCVSISLLRIGCKKKELINLIIYLSDLIKYIFYHKVPLPASIHKIILKISSWCAVWCFLIILEDTSMKPHISAVAFDYFFILWFIHDSFIKNSIRVFQSLHPFCYLIIL